MTAQSALMSRLGGQAYYDDVLDVTWLADSTLAASMSFGVGGIAADGRMDQATADSWIAAMNAATHLGFSDWRLPVTLPVDGVAYDQVPTFDGSTDISYNISAPGSAFPGSTASEMANLHYSTLGNLGFFDVSGAFAGCAGPGLCLANSGPLSMEAFYYWSGTKVIPDPAIGIAFHFGTGLQLTNAVTDQYFAWALRDGDVAVIPVPPAMLLMASGLALFGWNTRRRATK